MAEGREDTSTEDERVDNLSDVELENSSEKDLIPSKKNADDAEYSSDSVLEVR